MPSLTNVDLTNKCGSCKFAKSAYFQVPMGEKSYVICSFVIKNRKSELTKVKARTRKACPHYEIMNGYKYTPNE